MTSTSCPKGEELSQGYCYPLCNAGYTGNGPLCSKDCPAGFANLGPSCSKPFITRSNPINSIQTPCAPGQRDDGANCWSDQNCSYVPTPDKTSFQLQCSGYGTIKSTQAERTKCPAGYELINNLCYANCPTGYTSSGTRCLSNCPTGYTDNGLHCLKPTYTRKMGSMRSYPLKHITDDPRKSTLLKRIEVGSNGEPSPENTYKNLLGFGSSSTDASNALQGFYSNASAGGSNASGSDSFLDPRTWYILIAAGAVLALIIFVGPLFTQVVGTAVRVAEPVLVSTTKAIGKTAETGVSIGLEQAQEATQATLGTAQKATNEMLAQQKQYLEEIAKLRAQLNQ